MEPPRAPESSAVAVPEAQGFKLPVDPLRLVRAVWRGKWSILLGAVLGLALGSGFSLWRSQTRYEVSLQLIKRYAPPTLQAGTNGEPYKPRQFTNATLAGAAKSFNVLSRVAVKAHPPVSVNVLKQSVTVTEEKPTDFLNLQLSAYYSADDTVTLANLWANEVVEFTREMQAQESREVRNIIQAQLDSNQGELHRIETEFLALVGGLGTPLFSSSMPPEAFLQSRAEIDTRYETAKVEVEAISSQLEGLRRELERQTPASEALRQARAELEDYRTRYTDQNPLVVERLEKVAALEKEQKPAKPSSQGDFSNLANTYVGNQLYLTMVQLDSRRNAAEQQLQALMLQRDLFTKSPEKPARMVELLQKKQMLRTAQSLLLTRLQEARIFEENAPAFYGIFAPADVEHVAKKSKSVKVVAFGIGGLIFGLGVALFCVLVASVLDRKLRTPAEAAKAVGAALLGAMSEPVAPAAASLLAPKLWTRWLTPTLGRDRRPRPIWCPAAHDTESGFWRMQLTQARRLLPGLLVVDGGRVPEPEIAALPWTSLTSAGELLPAFSSVKFPLQTATLAEAQELEHFIGTCTARGLEVWLRLEGPLEESAAALLRMMQPPLVLVALHDQPTRYFGDQADLLRQSGAPAPVGVVALNDLPLLSRA